MLIQLSEQELSIIAEWLLVSEPRLTAEKALRSLLRRKIAEASQRVIDLRDAKPHRRE